MLLIFPAKSSEFLTNASNVQSPSKIAAFIDFASDVSHSTSPFSDTKGIGQWQESKFAKIRLLSADSGTNDLKHIWLALEVRLNNFVTMKRPSLSVKESDNVQNMRYFWPITLPLQPTEGLIYTYATTFPLEITLEKQSWPVSVQIALSADFCKQECVKDTIMTELKIPAGKNYYSPYSSFIRRSLDFTPNIATANEMQMGLLSKNALWLKANLSEDIKNPSFLILNEKTNEPIDFILKNAIIQNNQALFRFETKETIDNPSLLIFMHSDNQMWQINGVPEKAKIPPFFSETKANSLPLSLWLFFMLMMPSFVLFIKQKPRNEIIAKKENLKNMLFVLIGTLCGTLIYWIYPYSVLESNAVWLIFGILMFAFLGYFPYPVTAFGYGILNAVVPFFAFFERAQVPIPNSFSELLNFFAILSVVASIPFLIGIFKPILCVRLGKKLNHKLPSSFCFPMWLDMILFVYLELMLLFR